MKKVVYIIFLICFVCLLFAFYVNYEYKDNIPILAYHSVLEETDIDTNIEIDKFDKEMKWISKHFNTLSMDEYYDFKVNNKKLKGRNVVITFDDGVSDFYTNALKILDKYNLKATVFVVDSYIDNGNFLTSKQIDDIKKNHKNINIEYHSYNMHELDLTKTDDYDFYYNDIKSASDKYKYYAYPFGYSNDNYKKALIDNNIKLAFSYNNVRWSNKDDDNYNIPRVAIYNSNSFLKFKLKLLYNKK